MDFPPALRDIGEYLVGRTADDLVGTRQLVVRCLARAGGREYCQTTGAPQSQWLYGSLSRATIVRLWVRDEDRERVRKIIQALSGE
jgi:hypothetical protein